MKTSLISSALMAAALLATPGFAFAQSTMRDFTSENAQRQYTPSQDPAQRQRAVNQQRRSTDHTNQSMEDWSVHYNNEHIFGN